MGALSIQHLLVVLVVVLLLFGSKKLPEIGGGLGRAIKNFKKATTEPDEIDITARNNGNDHNKSA
ncbi:twin-arginine translocase TatA/TatE family subunit [Desulfovibrio sp. 86]|jgi:sec-independent protein translocase protein TatA|uniref:Sec-independent protein translocase protein TatA n=1 Tax=uncultured Desulfovibrio sp. TaxID=167968 RepID=A0A212L9T1_9BACT|nr:twin-arginine translocase TatA/TatE family subunit [Desulfovibrio sp. 86]SCM74296.1 Sec-independent protein translocase protein TatA [uncultured Desulfovibrio sp.]VZH34748.1 Sec-independent protein translocase protein TatA [Desulfovibrio sp. 86]